MKIIKILNNKIVNNISDLNWICTCLYKNNQTCDIYENVFHSMFYLKIQDEYYRFNIGDVGHYLLKNKSKIDRRSKLKNILNF